MTRDELIETVAKASFDMEQGFSTTDGFKKQIQPIRDRYCSYAVSAIDTIFAAMQEPSEAFQPEMISYHHGMSRLDWWQAMLAASPLAPEGGRE